VKIGPMLNRLSTLQECDARMLKRVMKPVNKKMIIQKEKVKIKDKSSLFLLKKTNGK
jgi:hypothetical protein